MLLGLVLARPLLLAAQLTEDQHDTEHRAEQDELRGERVEGADVEVERGDEIGVVLTSKEGGLRVDQLTAKLSGHDVAIDFSIGEAVI